MRFAQAHRNKSWSWRRYLALCLLAAAVIAGASGSPRAHALASLDPAPWDQATPGVDYVADELVVGFKADLFSVPVDDPASLSPDQVAQLHSELKARAASLAQAYGYQVRDTSPAIPVALLRLPAGTTPLAAMAALRDDSRVAFAEPNTISSVEQTTPADPCWSDATDPCFNNQKGHATDVGAQRGWDTIAVDFSVRIAVLDTGFHFDHPDKWYDVSTTEDRDFVTDYGPGYYTFCAGGLPTWRNYDLTGYDADALQWMDLQPNQAGTCLLQTPSAAGSHGTKVAGTIASAWENGEGGVGVVGRLHLGASGSVTIIPIQVLDNAGGGTSYDIAQGILYAGGLPASNGQGGAVVMPRADIVNMSFGGSLPTVYEQGAVGLANLAGALLIASVGNDGVPLPSFPAWYAQVLSVSAIDTSEALANYLPGWASNWGKVELTAPGDSVYTTGYDYSGCPMLPAGPCVAALGGAPTYAAASGTSLAAPHVAGIAALYKAHNDSATNADLRQMLLDFAADWGQPGPDPQFGYGLVQAAPGRGVALVTDRGLATVYLVSKATGTVQAVAAPGGNFTFLNVQPGQYFLLAATDEDQDGIFGETGEAVGAGGGGGALQNAQARFWPGGTINGTINFPLGWPGAEPEPANNASTGAGAMFVGLYAEASYSGVADIDWFRFQAPADGFYRIWTEGRNTVECREEFNEMDPMISLYGDPTLAPLASDLDGGEGSCAEIASTWLTRGKTYFVTVESQGIAPDVGFATILHIDGP